MTETENKPARPNDVRYWHELIDASFMLWFENGRDAKKVVETLKTDPVWREIAMIEEDEQVPHPNTIKRWAKDKFWDYKASQKMRELSPQRIQAAALEMAYGSEEAAKSLIRIASGKDVVSTDKIVADAAKFVVQSVVGDSIVEVVKPVIQESVDIDNLETMEDVVLAEQRIRELSG